MKAVIAVISIICFKQGFRGNPRTACLSTSARIGRDSRHVNTSVRFFTWNLHAPFASVKLSFIYEADLLYNMIIRQAYASKTTVLRW